MRPPTSRMATGARPNGVSRSVQGSQSQLACPPPDSLTALVPSAVPPAGRLAPGYGRLRSRADGARPARHRRRAGASVPERASRSRRTSRSKSPDSSIEREGLLLDASGRLAAGEDHRGDRSVERRRHDEVAERGAGGDLGRDAADADDPSVRVERGERGQAMGAAPRARGRPRGRWPRPGRPTPAGDDVPAARAAWRRQSAMAGATTMRSTRSRGGPSSTALVADVEVDDPRPGRGQRGARAGRVVAGDGAGPVRARARSGRRRRWPPGSRPSR